MGRRGRRGRARERGSGAGGGALGAPSRRRRGFGLTSTVARFNADVERGHDDEFNRGDNTYDNFWGDTTLPAPHATLGVIDQPPYYAIKMEPGVNGTCGGPRANGDAQVLDWNGAPIDGLYIGSYTMSAARSARA